MSATKARGKSRPMFAREQQPRPLNAHPDSLRAFLDLAAFVHLPHDPSKHRFPLAAPTLRSPGAPPRRPKSPHTSTPLIPLPPAAGHRRVAFPSVLATPRCRSSHLPRPNRLPAPCPTPRAMSAKEARGYSFLHAGPACASQRRPAYLSALRTQSFTLGRHVPTE